MSSAEIEHGIRTSAEFAESSIFEAVVPEAADADLGKLIEGWDGAAEMEDDTSILPWISQRQFLFLGKPREQEQESVQFLLISRGSDELVPVYVVLRTPFIDENTLKSYLSRLAIHLETYATGIVLPPNARSDDPGVGYQELVHSETVTDSEEPFVVASDSQSDDDTAAQHYVHVVWKVLVTIGKRLAFMLSALSDVFQLDQEPECKSCRSTLHHPPLFARRKTSGQK